MAGWRDLHTGKGTEVTTCETQWLPKHLMVLGRKVPSPDTQHHHRVAMITPSA